ncbi:MAG: lysophospholipase [Kiritimatiellaeota bacterium]|nr:lysophospholipase [Kiritimatiellota bacterium]
MKVEITTSDGLKLCGQEWTPDAEVKAVVCLVHGLGEHCGRYEHVAETLNRHRIALVAFDLRGHGQSGGKRGHAPSYERLMSDIFQGLENARKRYPNLPLFLYGHSLGGNLVIHYALQKHPDLTGVIASAPLLRLPFEPPAWKTGLLRRMYALWPRLTLPSGLETAALSRDTGVVRAYRNDPLVHDRISARLGVDMLDAGEWNLEHAAEFPLPLLLMHSDTDRITCAQASREFAKRAGQTCTLKVWEKLYHDLHQEAEQREVLAVVLEWMEQTATYSNVNSNSKGSSSPTGAP